MSLRKIDTSSPMAFQEAYVPGAFAIKRDPASCKEGTFVEPPLVHAIHHPASIWGPAFQII
jgi:hypothetical protein